MPDAAGGRARDLREEYLATGRLKRFLTSDDDSGTHAEAAADLAISEGAVKVAVHRLRDCYRDVLCDRVAATMASEDDVADEIQHLLQALGTRPGSS